MVYVWIQKAPEMTTDVQNNQLSQRWQTCSFLAAESVSPGRRRLSVTVSCIWFPHKKVFFWGEVFSPYWN